MEVNNKIVKYLLILAMFTVLSASSITIERSLLSSKYEKSRDNRMRYYRLPNNTIPHQYHIYLEPFMDNDNLTWNGDVSIDIEIIESTSILTLHAHYNLEIIYEFTELFDAYGSSFIPSNQYRNDAVDFLKIQFDKTIYTGNYSLNIRFTGEETCCLSGFFKHKITGNRIFAATSFEPTAARRAFPCFDEPGLKARFRLTVKHLSNYTVFSNMMKPNNHRTVDGMMLTDFPSTPIMSTYLLNIIISNNLTILNYHYNVSLLTRLPLENVRYLLDLSFKVVNVMESYTGIPFGFPTVGSIVMPYYPTKSTEQWGLISYNEADVNGNKSLLTSAQNDSAYLMVAHELAHSWFGNRVTALWWNDFWLNEAFAIYFQYYIMDLINDNWGGVKLFVLSNNHEAALPADTVDHILGRSIPITTYEIIQQLKPLTHRKGAAIIHMFRNVLGDKVFRAGIHKYIATNSFKSVVLDDLINALQDAYNEGNNNKTDLNLKAVMYPWLENKGYPVVKVTRNYTSGKTTLLQRSNTDDGGNDKWWIPFNFATKSNPNFTSTLPIGWISVKKSRAMISGIDKNDWIILNVQSSGYYRVNYDDENWNRIAKYLDTDDYKNIHVLNRAQLISDAFYLAQREPDSYYYNFYNIIKYLSREDEYLPWRAAHYAITRIADSLPSSSEAYILFQNYILELMEGFIQKVGFEPREYDDHYTKLSRMDVINWACINGHHLCVNYAAKKIKEYATNPIKNQLHPDTRSWIFCAGLKGLNIKETKIFSPWAYRKAKDLLIESIGCTMNHEIHEALLYVSIIKNGIGDPRETAKILKTLLASSQENFNYAIDFFIKHRSALNDSILNHEWYKMSEFVDDIFVEVKTSEQLEKFSEIFKVDVILEDPKIQKDAILIAAKRNVATNEASTKRFLKCWDKLISTFNSLRDDTIFDFVPMLKIN